MPPNEKSLAAADARREPPAPTAAACGEFLGASWSFVDPTTLKRVRAFVVHTSVINRDFPFSFLSTVVMGLFRDFPPAPQVCKPFFQSFSLAKGGVHRGDQHEPRWKGNRASLPADYVNI